MAWKARRLALEMRNAQVVVERIESEQRHTSWPFQKRMSEEAVVHRTAPLGDSR